MVREEQRNELRHDLGVPIGSTEITVDDVRLAVAREGQGNPVVCLHAIGHGGRDFEAFTAAIKDRFEVIRIDWPGQGRSAPDAKPPTAARYAELLSGILAQLRIDDPIIVGNSIGGATAILYAATHPVRALVLCDTGGLFEITPAVQRICRLFARFFDAGARRAWWYRTAFAFYYRLVLPSPAAASQRKRIVRAAFEIAPVLRDAWFGFAAPEADIRDVAANLQQPIWLAWAKSDRVIPLSYARPAIARLKHARVTRIRGGHAAFLERPKQFTREFLKFARSLEPKPQSSKTLFRR
jgi:pimeloyl-ACP methyl ester carboxylesterase